MYIYICTYMYTLYVHRLSFTSNETFSTHSLYLNICVDCRSALSSSVSPRRQASGPTAGEALRILRAESTIFDTPSVPAPIAAYAPRTTGALCVYMCVV